MQHTFLLYTHYTYTPPFLHITHPFPYTPPFPTHTRFLVRVSYLELYNEEVRDLLSKTPTSKLEVRERPDIGVYVKDLSSFVVKNANEMDRLMSAGSKNSESTQLFF